MSRQAQAEREKQAWVILVRVKNGRLKRGQKIRMMANGAVHPIEQLGVFTPKMKAKDELGPGEMGYITAAIKTVADCKVGDTITDDRHPAAEALPGFKPSIPVVWCGLYPVDADDFEKLRDSLGRLQLNDASFHYEAETSAALGFGYRCGFLGLLHLEIIQERLSREFDLNLIATAPSVVYKIFRTNGEMELLHNPSDMPDGSVVDHIEEPWIRATIMVPDDYLGAVLTLCNERRGQQADLTYVGNRAMAVYKIPLNEVVFDFYDRLKSISRGYASFDYQMEDYAEADLVKISILVNLEPVDALSFIAHRSAAEIRGRAICAKLKDLIPSSCSKSPSRPPSAAASWRARRSPPSRKTSPPNAMAAISAASASCWKSRKRAKSACASSARWKSRKAPSWPP